MANLVRARSWGKVQPPPGSQVDWGHPIAQGLGGAWIANAAGGRTIVDLVANNTLRAVSTDVASVWQPLGLKTGLAGGVNTGYTSGTVSSSLLPAGVGCSWMWRGVIAGVGDFASDIIVLEYDNAGGSPFGVWGYYREASGDIVSNIWNQAGVFGHDSTYTAAVTPGVLDTFVTTWVFGGNMTTFRNGVQIAVRGPLAGPTWSATPTLRLNGGAINARGANVITDSAAFWNRPLARGEIAHLNVEPYAFMAAPGPKILYFALGSPVAATSLALSPATITVTPVAQGITPGAVSKSLSPATVTVTPVALAPSAGAVSAALSPATITTTPVTLGVSPGAVSLALTPGTITVTAQPLGLVNIVADPIPVMLTLREQNTVTAIEANTVTVREHNTITARERP